MDALTFNLKTKELELVKRENPKIIKDNDVLIKVLYGGVCGTDIHIIGGGFPCNDKVPFVMGHEFVGVIVESGPKAHFHSGQRVTVDPHGGCNVCVFCRSGKYHMCETGGTDTTIGMWVDGGWAQFCCVSDTQVFVIPEDVTYEQAVLCEPLSCLVRGWDRVGSIPVGENILIMGAGIIGNLWATLFHLQGHKNVTISEMNVDRLTAVAKMGLNYKGMKPDEVTAAKAVFDVIVDCTGAVAALEAAMPLLGPGGRYVVFGCANPLSYAKINPFHMFKNETTIIGVKTNPFSFPKAIGLINAMGDRYLNFEKLGIEVFPLSQYQDAFKKLKEGSISKAIFKCNESV